MTTSRGAQQPIHSLEIPLKGMSLLLPSAAVAEVTNPAPISPVPGGPVWLLGAFGWRAQAVPVVSFEGLIEQATTPVAAGSRIVVLYPLRGGRAGGFFAFYAIAEPRPQSIIEGAVTAVSDDGLPDSQFIAAGVKIRDRVLYIPDFDALKRAFYP